MDSPYTDRGGQYASSNYRSILNLAQMRQSMSRAGDCYDNAFMQSCYGTLRTEREMTTYGTLEEARRELEEYINYYNAIRRHSSLDYRSPTRCALAVEIRHYRVHGTCATSFIVAHGGFLGGTLIRTNKHQLRFGFFMSMD